MRIKGRAGLLLNETFAPRESISFHLRVVPNDIEKKLLPYVLIIF